MTDKTLSIVCVGAGQAALSCAAKLRALGHTGAIALVGDEPHLPYQRPPLSKKYLTGEMPLDRLLLRPPEWFEAQSVTCLTGERVTGIDRAGHGVALASGRSIPYDRLVLATGCTPRHLPAAVTRGLAGLHTVRNIADIDRMAPELRAGARAVVIGGGYIGLEAASVAVKRGVAVTILEAASRILERVACKETSAYFESLHRGHGVDILTGVTLDSFEGAGGRLSAALLADGRRFPCDLAIIGIGVTPNTQLAAEAGLAIDNGVAVDEFCRSSDPDIFAIGDCASFPYRGQRLRLESVPHAIAQGDAAAAVIAGQGQPYEAKPWFWSDQYDVKLQIAGLNLGYDQVVTRGPGAAGDYSVWYYRQGRLIAVDAANAATAYMVGKRLIESGKTVSPDCVADPASDMKSWLTAG
jgi:3-phenylpropionate/trans-cinnamate dioxygenase ferredoxin reductase subunit